jgi:hypothetical protein
LTLRNDRSFWRTQKILPVFMVCVVAAFSQPASMPSHVDASGGTAPGIVIPSSAAKEAVRSSDDTLGPDPTLPFPAPQLVWLRLNLPMLPSPRIGFSMTLDTTDHRALLFGGYLPIPGGEEYFNELWSTDGYTWEQVFTSVRPIERIAASLVYDEAHQEAVLFGGYHNYEYFGATWIINPGQTGWIQLVPQTSPPPRADASMAFDAARGETVLFGGVTVPNGKDITLLNDTWTWDGANWQRKLPATLPPARNGSNMVYDRARQNIVLFGGGLTAALLDDTWFWNGTNWIEQHPLHIPPRRANFGMAYDEFRQQVIVFGGQASGDLSTWTQTWAWDGQDWTQLETSLNPPTGMAFGAQLVYLSGLHSIVLFGDNSQKICTDYDCTVTDESQMYVLTYQYLNYFPIINR